MRPFGLIFHLSSQRFFWYIGCMEDFVEEKEKNISDEIVAEDLDDEDLSLDELPI